MASAIRVDGGFALARMAAVLRHPSSQRSRAYSAPAS
jgi:hypothetical protein